MARTVINSSHITIIGRSFVLLLAGLTLLGAGSATLNGRQALDSLPEYEIKAAFLLNFARFTEWPEPRPAGVPLVFGITGASPFDDPVLKKITTAKVNGRTLEFRHISTVHDLDCCQILFISSSEDRKAADIIQAAHARGILTVGESAAFAQAGGMIRFFNQENSVRFEVNLTSVEGASLKLSAMLLSVARVVRNVPETARP